MRALFGRVRNIHRDEAAQVMPLVMAFGIAFFSGVVLVMNTGRTVNKRIEAQNAVDAALVSSTTSL
ncbi:MAG: pilus assembly protein TadG-related protein, partial [Planctomycetota bacterium]|nr:pilus assembly protein TadG-related protein [Planctomycetota bacterium]